MSIFSQLWNEANHGSSSMFPSEYHFAFNQLALVFLSIIMLVKVLYSKNPSKFSKLHEKGKYLFGVYLLMHFQFYLMELRSTGMLQLAFSMAVHHMFAIFIFSYILYHLTTLWFHFQLVYFFPFFIHAIFWAFNLDFMEYYNLMLLLCGIHGYFTLTPPLRTMSYLTLALCITNFHTYCYEMEGKYCLRSSEQLPFHLQIDGWINVFWMCSLLYISIKTIEIHRGLSLRKKHLFHFLTFMPDK